jgi:hypothetical protein
MDRTRAPVAAVKAVGESLVRAVRKALAREFGVLVRAAFEEALLVTLVEQAMVGPGGMLKAAFVEVARLPFVEAEKLGIEGVVMADTVGAEMAVFEAVETAALVDLGIPVPAEPRRAGREEAQLVAAAVADRVGSRTVAATKGMVLDTEVDVGIEKFIRRSICLSRLKRIG